LAQQVKDNTKATQAATYQHLTEHITGITFAISRSEEFASFIQRVGESDGGPKKPTDRIRWASYAYSIFRNLDNLYYQCTIGTLDKDKRDELIKIAVEWNFKYYPQMRHYWRRYGHLFDQKFRGYVEEILTNLDQQEAQRHDGDAQTVLRASLRVDESAGTPGDHRPVPPC
jgi:hypothetical protein